MKKLRTLTVGAIIGIAICVALLIAATPAQASTTSAPLLASPITYTVRVGDTWSKISNIFGVSASRLLDFNERRTTNRIALFAGETIKIPIELNNVPSLTSPFLYTVQSEDTVESITQKFYIDKYAMLNTNGIAQGQLVLTAGQTILIPAGPHRYQVKKNDTLQNIAALFGTNASILLPYNPQLSNGKIFYPGMWVYIPVIYDLKFTPSPFGGTTTGSGTVTSTQTSPITLTGNGLNPNPPNPDEIARAANATVVNVIETISMPQNVVNLNQAFEIRTFRLNNVQRDSSRENGAIATVTMQFRGGTGTYTIRSFIDNQARGAKMTGIYVNNDNGQLWNDIDIPVLATCAGNATGDFIITVGASTKWYHYEFKNIACPSK